MLLSLIIVLILIYTVSKTFTYGLWCFRRHSYAGGISIMLLCALMFFSGMVILRA